VNPLFRLLRFHCRLTIADSRNNNTYQQSGPPSDFLQQIDVLRFLSHSYEKEAPAQHT